MIGPVVRSGAPPATVVFAWGHPERVPSALAVGGQARFSAAKVALSAQDAAEDTVAAENEAG